MTQSFQRCCRRKWTIPDGHICNWHIILADCWKRHFITHRTTWPSQGPCSTETECDLLRFSAGGQSITVRELYAISGNSCSLNHLLSTKSSLQCLSSSPLARMNIMQIQCGGRCVPVINLDVLVCLWVIHEPHELQVEDWREREELHTLFCFLQHNHWTEYQWPTLIKVLQS